MRAPKWFFASALSFFPVEIPVVNTFCQVERSRGEQID